MLSYILTDIYGEHPESGAELSFRLNAEEGVPADDVTVIFPYKKINELSEITVLDDGEVIFRGVVDEQQNICAASGLYLRITARSLAAHLLDNEAVPVTYNQPSVGLIAERHAQPYGIVCADSPDIAYYGELVVTKGMSEWQVIEQFASMCFASCPRIGADGVLSMHGVGHEGEIVFADEGEGVRYAYLNERVKRCEEISRVNVRVNSSGYLSRVENAGAHARGIRRERYLNAAVTDTPMQRAETMIRSGRRAGYSLMVSVPCRLTGCLGAQAVVRNREFGVRSGLYVSALTYALTARGESTDLILRRRDP